MVFCAECGKTIPKNAKFCPGCGAKVITEVVDDPKDLDLDEELKKLEEELNQDDDSKEEIGELSKLFDDKTDTNKEIIEEKKDESPILEFVEKEKWDELKGLHKFFTKPYFKGNLDQSSLYSYNIDKLKKRIKEFDGWGYGVPMFLCGGFTIAFLLAYLGSPEGTFDRMCAGVLFIPFLIFTGMAGSDWINARKKLEEDIKELSELEEKRKKTDKAAINDMREEKEWREMSPEPLFKRLEEAQELVAKSSYENLGIGENNTTRPPAYCYGPHLEIFGDIFGNRTDQTGIGKGADYYKFCEKEGMEGLYTREYDMMVVQFTKKQIMVYKCIFDILEMTKRLEESYEWNYKHVVGINITGDEKEKDLGGGIAITGTKYLVISAASGDKIEIVLGAGTRQMDNGKQNMATLGGEERIYKVANNAMKNIREAVREGAN